METTVKIVRSELLEQIVERDGTKCAHPDCGKEVDMSLTEGDWRATIDHIEPQSWCYDQGWTREEVWDMSNLALMHRKCNAEKGDRRYKPDGTLPPKPISRFRYRRQKRAGRAEFCVECHNGHNLEHNEVCASCGTYGKYFNRADKVKFQDCDHEILWCYACSITPEMRPSSIGTAMRQADSTELGEYVE